MNIEGLITIIESRSIELKYYTSINNDIEVSLKNSGFEAFNSKKVNITWQKAFLPFTWKNSGELWFKKEIIVPEKVQNIDVKSSSLTFTGKKLERIVC